MSPCRMDAVPGAGHDVSAWLGAMENETPQNPAGRVQAGSTIRFGFRQGELEK